MWGASTRPFPTRHAKHPGLEPRLPEWQGSDGPEYLGLIHRRIAKIPYIHLPGHIRFEPFASKRDAVLMWINAFFASPLIFPRLSAQPIKGLTYHSEASAKVFSMRQTSLGAPEM